jgi:hypothetical protein
MATVSITYNPYKLTTAITVNGQKPKQNSSLNVENRRLQEWVENLPRILVDEWRDNSFEITFTGTQVDFDDLRAAFDTAGQNVKVTFKFVKRADVADVEKAIDDIFADIQNGPVEELKDERIKVAFKKAKNQQFEINVVATMSSGKSTLINALLGKQLMPTANEATTATIVRIVDDKDKDVFSAKAFDQDGNLVKELESVSLGDMKALNSDPNVSIVELQGNIPFVRNTGMRLVLIDTPGPNNSRDKRHEQMTYEMLENSDKSLVLFVMNGEQLSINDEKTFLDFVCGTMKDVGKQARERYIFAVNKLDAYKPKDEGLDCIDRALDNVKKGLEDREIICPNIFPVAALPALQLRSKDDEAGELSTFIMRSNKYECMHFDNYYSYSHLPMRSKAVIDAGIVASDDNGKVLFYTGIKSIEEAINQYVNKYARTTKVNDLVQSFNGTLDELATVEKIEEAIRNDKSKKDELEKQIVQIQKNIKTARQAKTVSSKIDGINLTDKVEKKVTARINDIRNQISSIISSQSNKVEKSEAREQCVELEKRCKALPAQINAQIAGLLDETYKETLHSIIEEYEKYLSDLNLGISANTLSFNPINLVMGSLNDLSRIIEDNTDPEDESYNEREAYKKPVEGGFIRKVASFLTFGWIDDHTYETAYRDKRIEKYVDYVDMEGVALDYLQPIQKKLEKIKKQTVKHALDETKRLKKFLGKAIEKIDNLLDEKLSALYQITIDSKATAAEITRKEDNLKWLKGIQERVDSLIEF